MEDTFEARCLAEDAGMGLEPERTVEQVTVEIQTLHRQAQQMALGYAIEIGRRLVEVKAMLPHGQWGEYLRERLGYKPSTAQNFMRIFQAYGADQQSLFGPVAKSQALGDLSYTKALALLVLPDEERESFLEDHDVEAMSSRELQATLKELAQAKEEAQTAEQARKKAEEEIRLANERLEGMGQEVQEARNQAEGYRLKLAEQQKKSAAEAEAAGQALEDLRRELAELRDRPVEVAVEQVVDQEAVQKAAEEARAAAEEALKDRIRKAEQAKEKAVQAKKKAEDRLNALKEEGEAALQAEREGRTAAEARLAQAEKALSMASTGEIAAFRVYFAQMQEQGTAMWEIIHKLEASGQTETAEKLKNALRAVVERMMQDGGVRKENDD